MSPGDALRSHPEKRGMAMARRFLFRALVPAAVLALSGAIGLTPASASTATWQISLVAGDPAGQTQFGSVAASSSDNAWAGGTTCGDSACDTLTAIVEQWNGQVWQPVTLPDSNLGGSGGGVVVGTSSASDTWIFGSDVNDIGYGVHVTNSGMTETTLPANGGISFNGAAVFGPNDAWAFGVTGNFTLDNFSAYAAHYNGQAWTELPTPPVVPDSVSALSKHDMWILGQTSLAPSSPIVYEAARWTGHGWLTVPMPDDADLNLPASTAFQPVSILALSKHNVWVTANVELSTCCGVGAGVLLLHWNGNDWQSVAVPASISAFDQDIASDGQGGLWVSGYSSTAESDELFQFQDGQWSGQPDPTQDGDQPSMYGLTWVPFSTSLWGAAGLLNTQPNGTTGIQGAIYQYGP
jgi:hypothetical protein